MNFLQKIVIVFIFLLISVTPNFVAQSYALSAAATTAITEWEMIWEEDPYQAAQNGAPSVDAAQWQSFSFEDSLPEKPTNIQSAWLRFQLPDYDFARPSLMISKLTAKDVSIFINNKLIYKSERNYPYNKNEILLSVSENEANQMVYILLHTDSDWLGLKKPIILGEDQALSKMFMKKDMLDVVIGGTLLLISLGMFLCFMFLNRSYLAGLSSLGAVIFCIALMILSLSTYLHTAYRDYGQVIYYMFDIGSNLLMPSLFIFFEKIFGRGPYGLITRFRKLQVVVSAVSILWLFASFISSEIKSSYILVTTISFGGTVVIGNILLFVCLIRFCLQKNKEAIIITTGFGFFALIGVLEIVWYFIKNMNYDLFFWKFGIFSFIAALVIILARRILQNYEQVVSYSKQLEVFNNELQRSEKMEIISQLAASVAHEVRNPLQVTRGFLQLLRETSINNKEKGFMVLAIDELDRASDIITDFLTFAKPQIEQTTILNVSEELRKIEGMLIPLANMQGGVLKVDTAADLYVHGNSSKLTQALINIIKNSIEAIDTGGSISIRAYLDDSNHVIINIRDNGEGMDEYDLKRLGEPYYSKKTKGTGLGLMVTFRIIEVMQGRVEFFSTKGIGTEAVIQIPSAKK
ncbi:sensor histidine kinase [Paenibacillus paridis]|uniref:sensor histidine kinase n=1 Tax=Paenibacillus paridis TaxID=2583376 RepID=UPI001123E5F9|nr:sensor histidine kinase [Paenibacillus paridis]